jgi:hypothetical protein
MYLSWVGVAYFFTESSITRNPHHHPRPTGLRQEDI